MPKRKAAAPQRKTRVKKLPWGDMTVTRVNLNPEQAVLTCCDNISRRAEGAEWPCHSSCGGFESVDSMSS